MNIAIILSGGIGSRMGLDMPKQYVRVGGRMIVGYCLDTFLGSDEIDAVVVGCADEWRHDMEEEIAKTGTDKPVAYARPGETRQLSVYNALLVADTMAEGESDVVIIHDAARPLVSHDLIRRCLDGCRDADGVMPVVAVKDTIYMSEDGVHISSLLDRGKLWGGQAPEAFRLRKYLDVHEAMGREEIMKINGSTEIAFKAGLDCRMVEGDPMNFKITTPDDLVAFENIIDKKK